MIKLILQKPDMLGAISSTLCAIHCIAAPLIFITHSIDSSLTSTYWWGNLDYFFLIVSLLAIIHSVKKTSKGYMKLALWLSWGTLCLFILNEKIHLVSFPEVMTYGTSIFLAVLHIYNMKYCQCKTDKCCIHNGQK